MERLSGAGRWRSFGADCTGSVTGVRQFRYRSMMKGLDDNAGRLSEFLRETEGDVLHVIGHSMGGVLIRQVFEQNPDPRPGRLIAIGSPLLDCWVGRRFYRMHPSIGRLMIGQTVADHISRVPDPVWHGARDFGVLAGTYRFGIGAIFKSLPRPSDGVVLLDENAAGRNPGPPHDPAEPLWNALLPGGCCAQIARFLATGSFDRPW